MIKESQQQADRREDVRRFFETKTIRKTSAGTAMPPAVSPRPTIRPPQGSKTANQANNKVGKVIFQDCDGNEVGRIEWDRRKILTEGEQIIRTGCEDSSSDPV